MGFLGLFGQKKGPKSAKKGPYRSPEERKALQQANKLRAETRALQAQQRFLASLANSNRPADQELYRQIMLESIGVGSKKESELATTLATLRALREAGLVDDPKSAGKEGLARELLSALQGIGPLVQAFAAQSAQPQPVVVSPAPVAQTPAPPQLTPQQAPPLKPEPEPESEPAPSVELHPFSQAIIGELDGKTPQQAAEWLVSQNIPVAKQLTTAIVRCPDENIPNLLAEIEQNAPALAGLVGWLRARPQWLMAMVHEVRRLAGPEQAAAMGV